MSDQQPSSNSPAYIAYHVNGQGRNANWVKIGAAWQSKDGSGYSLQIDAVPLNWDGRIVLRQPKSN